MSCRSGKGSMRTFKSNQSSTVWRTQYNTILTKEVQQIKCIVLYVTQTLTKGTTCYFFGGGEQDWGSNQGLLHPRQVFYLWTKLPRCAWSFWRRAQKMKTGHWFSAIFSAMEKQTIKDFLLLHKPQRFRFPFLFWINSQVSSSPTHLHP